MTDTPTKTNLYLRWLETPRQLAQVLHIERLSFDFPWSEQNFNDTLNRTDVIGMVAEAGAEVRGYMVYEIYRRSFHLLNLAVHRDVRRGGIGRGMIERLKEKLTPRRRCMITAMVGERNTDAQRFFGAVGFMAISVSLEYFQQPDLTTTPGYRFRYLHQQRQGKEKEAGRD